MLIKMLQHAHAAELAAYHAYEGHWRSVSDLKEQEAIKKIQQEEWQHVQSIERMLERLGSKPNRVRDTVFTVIGKTMSFLCYHTGWFLPMWGALVIEKIGVSGYYEILTQALYEGHPELCILLMVMMKAEEDHKAYFEGLLNA